MSPALPKTSERMIVVQAAQYPPDETPASAQPPLSVRVPGKSVCTILGTSSCTHVPTFARPTMSAQSGAALWCSSTLRDGATTIVGGMTPLSMASWTWGPMSSAENTLSLVPGRPWSRTRTS